MSTAHSLFPSVGLQALSALVHYWGITVMTFFISRRLLADDFDWRLRTLTWPRLCVLLVFFDSYLFLLSSGMLVFGVGLQLNKIACSAGIFICVAFYSTSKILIYLFLTEKVYIVWGGAQRRLRCPAYLVCMGSVSSYLVIMVVMFIYRVDSFRPGDGACVLGLKPTASIPLLSFDLYINILLTTLFLWPIFRSNHVNPQLKRVATKTLIASSVALTTSTINIAVLTILHGRELGWVCLASCGTDVIFNACALFWVTGAGVGSAQSTSGGVPAQRGANSGLRSPISPSARASRLTSGFLSMRDMTKTEQEFRIHVTTTSYVDTSPPMFAQESQDKPV
ncbi:hypothetical protein GGX14DRAFT_481597 [Mycena pura]|uniref:Uncharacterized protein n=1 Tax=Mycena pura TaxID=153505 RepID=A0AAD6XYX2_9AGAR|nr:hypothetical protein GGX14DRAFT_481597 [Mycena pura]